MVQKILSCVMIHTGDEQGQACWTSYVWCLLGARSVQLNSASFSSSTNETYRNMHFAHVCPCWVSMEILTLPFHDKLTLCVYLSQLGQKSHTPSRTRSGKQPPERS